VTNGPVPGVYRTSYALTGRPTVSILIPNRDQAAILARCIDSLARSTYDRYEILLVENNSREPETFAYYQKLEGRPNPRLLTWDRPFNYAAVNNFAAAQARGEVLLFLNNDVEVIGADWLERLLEHALRPEVGAVGAKLYYPDDKVQHAGVVLGVGAVAGHVQLGAARGAPGYC
jgi:GT2 family glycosyltransferase